MKYRKKPVIIEANQWFKMGDHEKVVKIPEYLNQVFNINIAGWIETLEGGHVVSPGDWIIREENEEVYPIKNELFEKTYELIEDEKTN